MTEKDISILLEENKRLKILLYKYKIDLEKYKKKYEDELSKNRKKEYDLLNVFDISNELALERQPANIEKILFYFIIGHFNFKPLLIVKYDKFKSSNFMFIDSVFGLSQKMFEAKGFEICADELNLISEKKEIFAVDDNNIPFDLIDNAIFFPQIKKIDIRYVMPVTNKKNNKILILFGNRQKEDSLNESELTILKVLKNSSVIALENAGLIHELDQKNLELSKNLGLVSELYEKIQTAYDELKEADKMKTDFLNLISHELRTPLTSIKAYTDTLLTESIEINDQERAEFIKIIANESLRMEDLINKILTFIELDSGKYNYNYILFKPKLLINEILEELNDKITAKNQSVNYDFFEDKIEIKADYQMLKTALFNLIDNAIKFTGNNCPITISLFKKENFWVISIKDSGIGINLADKDKIFTKFMQIEDINYHGEGLGLGLATALCIIEKGHNGKIWFENNANDERGVTFFISLPDKSEV